MSLFHQNFSDRSGDVAIQAYNSRHEVIYWNKASEQLYGYSEGEALGRELEDLIIPEPIRAQVRREIDLWMQSGLPPFGGILKLLHKDGSLVEVHSSHVINRSEGSDATMYCIDLRIEQWNTLPSIFRERENQSENEGNNAYTCLSHEFRTPLNAVVGLAESLRLKDERSLNDEDFGNVETILRSGYRLLSSFNHLLFLLAWARGDLMPVNRECRLFDTVIESLQDVSDASLMEGVQIELSEGEECPGSIHTDPYFLGQGVYAILMAAIYASKRGDHIRVVLKEHPERNQVLVEVSDSTAPVDDRSIFRIFTGRKNFAENLSQSNHGHVLFLPIAHDIAVALGAMFTIDQNQPVGNRYILALPRH